MTFQEQVIELLYKYEPEYREGFLEKAWKNHVGFSGFGYFESYIAYCLMREYKPFTTVDIGSACGFSTYPLNFACDRNRKGIVFSYELNEDRCKEFTKNMDRHNLFSIIHPGDVEKTIHDSLLNSFDEGENPIDILFMDASHSEPFAKWYIETLVSKTKFLLHVHDVSYLPDDGEIRTVLKWLDQNPHLEVVRTWELAYQNGDHGNKRPSDLVKELNIPIYTTTAINDEEAENDPREVRGEANSGIWVKLK